MIDRDVFRNLAKTASKKQNKGTYLWLVRMNQRSLQREWRCQNGYSGDHQETPRDTSA